MGEAPIVKRSTTATTVQLCSETRLRSQIDDCCDEGENDDDVVDDGYLAACSRMQQLNNSAYGTTMKLLRAARSSWKRHNRKMNHSFQKRSESLGVTQIVNKAVGGKNYAMKNK